MARRLTPEARRAEIVEIANRAIMSDGFSSLSLREIARRCGMSTPGLMHYFPDMVSLLGAVLEHRAEVEIATQYSKIEGITLVELLEKARSYHHTLPEEARQFDVLEAEALNPTHPAHQYFNERNQRMLERIRPIVEREYASPEEVMTLLGLIFDGFRLKSVREGGRHWTEDVDAWKIAYKALDSFPRM